MFVISDRQSPEYSPGSTLYSSKPGCCCGGICGGGGGCWSKSPGSCSWIGLDRTGGGEDDPPLTCSSLS